MTHKLTQLGAFASVQACVRNNKNHLCNSNQISFVQCAVILLPFLYHAWIDNYSGAIDFIRIVSRERGPA